MKIKNFEKKKFEKKKLQKNNFHPTKKKQQNRNFPKKRVWGKLIHLTGL